MRSKKTIVLLLLFTTSLLIMANDAIIEIRAQKSLRTEFKILVDEYHGAMIKADELYSLKILNETLKDYSAILRVLRLNERINYEDLYSIDLLIIPPTNGSIAFSDDEKNAIKSYIKGGGSLLVLGVPYMGGFKEFNPTILNDLFEYIFGFGQLGFFTKDMRADIVIDYTNDNGFLNLTKENVKGENLESLLNGTIIVKSASFERVSSDFEIIKTSSVAIRVDKDEGIYYNESGFIVLAMKEIGKGKVVATGFGQIFTGIKASFEYNVSWVELGDNKAFVINLLKYLINLKKWEIGGNIIFPWLPETLPIILLAISATSLGLYPIAKRKDIQRRAKLEEKRKKVKISEIRCSLFCFPV